MTHSSTPARARAFAGRMPIRDTHLWVERIGDGPLIIALHGGLGFDHTGLTPWLDPLADQATLVYVDQRGQGRSERLPPEVWETVTHATLVEDIDALRAAHGAERVILIGHSYGGFLSLDYALAHPERLAGLVLVSAAPSFAHGAVIAGNAIARDPVVGTRFIAALGALPADDAAYAAELPGFLSLYFHRGDGDGFMARTSYSAAAAARSLGALVGAWSVADRLAEIQVPTLVIGGDDDFISPLELCSKQLADGIPGATLAVMPECGHFAFVEQHERFLAAVRPFLAGLAR